LNVYKNKTYKKYNFYFNVTFISENNSNYGIDVNKIIILVSIRKNIFKILYL